MKSDRMIVIEKIQEAARRMELIREESLRHVASMFPEFDHAIRTKGFPNGIILADNLYEQIMGIKPSNIIKPWINGLIVYRGEWLPFDGYYLLFGNESFEQLKNIYSPAPIPMDLSWALRDRLPRIK